MFGGGRVWPVHIHVKYHPIEDVPVNEGEVAEWVRDLWKEKDELLVSISAGRHRP